MYTNNPIDFTQDAQCSELHQQLSHSRARDLYNSMLSEMKDILDAELYLKVFKENWLTKQKILVHAEANELITVCQVLRNASLYTLPNLKLYYSASEASGNYYNSKKKFDDLKLLVAAGALNQENFFRTYVNQSGFTPFQLITVLRLLDAEGIQKHKKFVVELLETNDLMRLDLYNKHFIYASPSPISESDVNIDLVQEILSYSNHIAFEKKLYKLEKIHDEYALLIDKHKFLDSIKGFFTKDNQSEQLRKNQAEAVSIIKHLNVDERQKARAYFTKNCNHRHSGQTFFDRPTIPPPIQNQPQNHPRKKSTLG